MIDSTHSQLPSRQVSAFSPAGRRQHVHSSSSRATPTTPVGLALDAAATALAWTYLLLRLTLGLTGARR